VRSPSVEVPAAVKDWSATRLPLGSLENVVLALWGQATAVTMVSKRKGFTTPG
jgi:hypothetical protein